MKHIDLIIPMVFPDDKQWREDYCRCHHTAAAAQQHVRFRSWGTEALLIKLCVKYMPWLRAIHILLASDSQVEFLIRNSGFRVSGGRDLIYGPYLYKDKPMIKLVYHKDFIPENLLPCFNVNTIEMFLHKIPDLSECFIYSNDDIFPVAPLQPEDFFRPVDGIDRNTNCQLSTVNCQLFYPCHHHDEVPYPIYPTNFQQFVKNGLDMVAKDYNLTFTDTYLRGGHSMQPMLLSSVKEVCRRHADSIRKSFTIHRSPENLNQYIFPFWQHMSGKYIDHTPKSLYLGPGKTNEDLVNIMHNNDMSLLIINDNERIMDWENRAAIVRRELISIYERG